MDDYFPHIGEWRRGEERSLPSEFEGWLAHEGPALQLCPLHGAASARRAPAAVPGHVLGARRTGPSSTASSSSSRRRSTPDQPFGPEEVKAVVDNYDAAIAYIDGEVGKLLKSLKDRGAYDESLIIVLSDHGESLYERDFWGHGSKVYEETTQVPLIVKFPASLGLKGRVEGVVELAGVFPTLLDLFGQSVGLDGKSWLPAVAARGHNDDLSVSRSFSNIGDFGLRWRDWHAIVNLGSGSETLYRRAEPVFVEVEPGNVRLLFEVRFLEWLSRFSELDERPVALDLGALPKNELENLRSLGYIK